jgi:PTS system mannose-specific IID component
MEEVKHQGTEMKKLPSTLLLKLVFRSLFIQAGWNYENFQGIGFAYALVPFLQQDEVRRGDGQNFVKRHLACFNTNPYLSGMILGGVVRLEEERELGRIDSREIAAYKQDLMGAFGALGDSFVWGALRPLAAIVAVLAAFHFETLAPFLFLFLYNSVIFWLRVQGVRNGYAYGSDLLIYLKQIDLQKKIYWINRFVLFSCGAVVPLWISQAVPSMNLAFAGLLSFVLILGGFLWRAERKEVPLRYQVAALLILTGLIGQMGWVPL